MANKGSGCAPGCIAGVLFSGIVFVGGIFVLMIIIGNVLSDPSPSSGEQGRPSTATLALTPTPAPTPDLSITYPGIKSRLKGKTEAQCSAYAEAIKGATVQWSGKVIDVNDKAFGGYELLIEMDESPADFEFISYDVYFDIPDSIALDFSKGQTVRFTGTIERAFFRESYCNFKLRDARVLR